MSAFSILSECISAFSIVTVCGRHVGVAPQISERRVGFDSLPHRFDVRELGGSGGDASPRCDGHCLEGSRALTSMLCLSLVRTYFKQKSLCSMFFYAAVCGLWSRKSTMELGLTQYWFRFDTASI